MEIFKYLEYVIEIGDSLRNAFFSIGSQDFVVARIIGALVIVAGACLLMGFILNTVDSANAIKAYPECMKLLDASLPEFSQARMTYCQESFRNITGVQLQADNPLGKSQQAQVLFNSIIKLCMSVAVIFFGVMLYRPFPPAKGIPTAKEWPHRAHHTAHRK